MMKSVRFVVILVATGFFGCVTSGKDFPSDISWIEKDETTQAQVRQLLGQPDFVGNSGGRPTWTYGFYRYRLIGDSHTKELKFYWNSDGTVDHYSFSSSFPDDTGKVTKGGESED